MAADITQENVPPFYREVAEILCPNQDQRVDQDMFIKLLVKSSLPKATLSQIWENVESQGGYLTRDGLYRALALTALAQQGVSTEGRGQLLKMPPSELPKPSLGDLTDLRMLGIQLRQEKNPSLLGLTYPEVCTLDSITLELVPGKKGLFLKHVEYEVTSQRYKTTVERRYTDFVALHELLLQRFPYRLIPSLPPKQGVSVVRENASFLETRRKALKRFLTLVARHPIIAEDKILHFFLTYVGPDMQHKIREHFKGVQDEFYTHPRAAEARELVPLDTGVQLPLVKERLRQLGAAVGAVRDLLAQGAGELQAASSRWQQLGRQLSLLIHLGPGEWGAIPGAAGPWGLSGLLQPTLQALATASAAQGDSQEEQLVEQLNIYLDQLAAFKELAERYDTRYNPETASSLKKATSPMGNGHPSTSPLQHLESRVQFFQHCIHLEVQLVNLYSDILGHVLRKMSSLHQVAAQQILDLWSQVKLPN